MSVSQGEVNLEVLQVLGNVAQKQRLKDAKSMVDTLVTDEDGEWLAKALKEVRAGKNIEADPKGGVVLETVRTFHFRSSKPEQNTVDADESAHYRSFIMPAGSRIVKMGGAGKKDWVLRVDNGREGTQWMYFLVAYRYCDVLMATLPVLKSYYCAAQSGCSGRSAGMRSRGSGPDRSVER